MNCKLGCGILRGAGSLGHGTGVATEARDGYPELNDERRDGPDDQERRQEEDAYHTDDAQVDEIEDGQNNMAVVSRGTFLRHQYSLQSRGEGQKSRG